MARTTTYKERDKYGRSCTVITVNGHRVGVAVLLPKSYRAANPGKAYLVRDDSKGTTDDAVTYHRNRPAALRQLAAVAEAAEAALEKSA
jgi:hypothetical protein